MAYFEWASDMVIDHDGPIDQDHRRLVAQVNRLHDATSQGSGQEIVAGLLEELLADTKEHLAHEERFMASVGFPESEAHRKGHDHSRCGRAGAFRTCSQSPRGCAVAASGGLRRCKSSP